VREKEFLAPLVMEELEERLKSKGLFEGKSQENDNCTSKV
jgi:hypothetical protein